MRPSTGIEGLDHLLRGGRVVSSDDEPDRACVGNLIVVILQQETVKILDEIGLNGLPSPANPMET
ncbi:MAG: hypothetical protein UY76_C0028G0004 [Candidatus Uhrbacteria bacterium GW2011_GWA2_52_8d]|uniref:Uncharacterized protein n=1 Tax=Candidatus Uhrbacteria bacterium GW2011_GWA2_52_8d TaxID=1618979 RepID=A0A0G1XMC1_9BACT|nr:MAG: hypothetical protein UY76_C0028G0004 [Candidatus Uhrbacteria bacterium GW2011_GWA2_52_8d]